MSIVTKESNPELYNSLFEDATIEDAKKVMQNMFNDITSEQFEELKKQAMENVKQKDTKAKKEFNKINEALDYLNNEFKVGLNYSEWTDGYNECINRHKDNLLNILNGDNE